MNWKKNMNLPLPKGRGIFFPRSICSEIKKGLLFGLLSLVFSLIISIFVGEFVVKHIFPQNIYQMARLVGLHFFEDGGNIPFTFQKNVKNFHHIGYTHEFDHKVSTNSLGTRGEEFLIDKPADTYRILFLGDSMTFGWGVNDNENYPYLAAKNLNAWAKLNNIPKKFESINAGFTAGRTLDSYYVYLKEKGLSFQPDLIILDFFPYNDYSDMQEMVWEKTDAEGYPAKIVSEKEKIEDGYIVKRIKTEWMFQIPVLRNSHLAILIFNALERGSPKMVAKIKDILGIKPEKADYTLEERLKCIYSLQKINCPSQLWEQFDKANFLLVGIKKQADDKKIPLLVTLMASPDQTELLVNKPDRENLLKESQPQKAIRSFLESQKIPYIDFLGVLSQFPAGALNFKRDGHLNKQGHTQVAQALTDYLIKNYFSPERITQ